MKIHYLHIGKTAGTTIKDFIKKHNEIGENKIIAHPHEIVLARIPAEDTYFFSIRDPITRFKSAFYSRKRKGQPRILVEWTKNETVAFQTFEHANDLAEALYEETDLGLKAFNAMQSITHIKSFQYQWVHSFEYLKRRPPFFILKQETLNEDMKALQVKLGLKDILPLDDDPVRSHKNSYEKVPALSEKAVSNLSK